MRCIGWVPAIACCTLVSACAAVPESGGIDEATRTLMQLAGIPGAAVSLVSEDGEISTRGYGVRRRGEAASVDADTVFEAASLSKPVVAYIALRMVERHELDLDRALQDYVPFPELAGDPRARLITTRLSLSHMTGLQNELLGGAAPRLSFRPGERFSYSGLGFSYLQRVLEHVSGVSLEELAQREVFVPLGMTRSSFVWKAEFAADAATGHDDYEVPLSPTRPNAARAPSSLHTSARDYARFVAAVLRHDGLSERIFDQMIQRQAAVADGVDWGLGWAIESGSKGRAIWHWGDNSNTGYTAYVIAYPDTGSALVYLSNSRGGLSILGDLLQAAGGNHPGVAYMNYERYDAPDRTLRRSLVAEIESHGASAGLLLYQRARAARDVPERVLNSVGYHLLQQSRPADAVAVMQRNAELFPDSWNAHDSLGEAYEAAGDAVLALQQYRRSLALNPANENASRAIERLRPARP
jgi:CubicO group peptidase (beta-lactamase class C family)